MSDALARMLEVCDDLQLTVIQFDAAVREGHDFRRKLKVLDRLRQVVDEAGRALIALGRADAKLEDQKR